jgi:hypothetical protein
MSKSNVNPNHDKGAPRTVCQVQACPGREEGERRQGGNRGQSAVAASASGSKEMSRR